MLSRLDPRSQRVVRNFLVRLSLYLWMLAFTARLGKWSYQQALDVSHLTCAMSALIAMALALFRGEKPAGVSLNLWDESLAFTALSLLALAILRKTS